METVTFKSDEARKRWRDLIDAALTGNQVVIERYDKPLAVLVNYEQWRKDQARLKKFELEAEARRLREKLASGKARFTSAEQLLQMIMEKRNNAAVAPVDA